MVSQGSFPIGEENCVMLHNPFVQELGPVMHQDSTADQNGKIGDIKAALEGPSGQCTHINHPD